VDPETLEEVYSQGRTVEIASEHFRVPSLDHLIALKLHAIAQNPSARESVDLPDIIRLVRANHIDSAEVSFKQLVLSYGSQALYDQIAKATDE
jgi:hypothetical protein